MLRLKRIIKLHQKGIPRDLHNISLILDDGLPIPIDNRLLLHQLHCVESVVVLALREEYVAEAATSEALYESEVS